MTPEAEGEAGGGGEGGAGMRRPGGVGKGEGAHIGLLGGLRGPRGAKVLGRAYRGEVLVGDRTRAVNIINQPSGQVSESGHTGGMDCVLLRACCMLDRAGCC